MAEYYPLMLKIKGKACTVVGGGFVAERKVMTLLEYGGDVTVISPSLTPKLHQLAKENKILHKNKHYKNGDLKGSFLVYAVTNDERVNKECREEAKKNNILINIGDSPQLSDFILPAIVKRGSLTITVSTEGKSPALSSKIRKEIEKLYNREYTEILNILEEIRQKAKKEIPYIEDRKKLFHQLVEEIPREISTEEEMEQLKEKMWQIFKKIT